MRIELRAAGPADADAIWAILKPVFRAGETYAVEQGISRADALAYWLAEHCFVAEDQGRILGSYYIQRNRPGGGAHYCNCGFVTSPEAQGRGIARAMLEDALVRAAALGFEGMVFNFVVASNTRALKLWQAYGFEEVGRVPGAFRPEGAATGTDALVMFRRLGDGRP